MTVWKCDFFEYYRAAMCSLIFCKFESGLNSPNPTIWLVPWAGGLLRSCPQTRAELLPDELCNGFFKHVNINHVRIYIIIAKRIRIATSRLFIFYCHILKNEKLAYHCSVLLFFRESNRPVTAATGFLYQGLPLSSRKKQTKKQKTKKQWKCYSLA